MRVQRLKYKLGQRARGGLKRCEANVLEATARWRTQLGKDYRCELDALYYLDGKYLCKRHAGDYLVTKYLGADKLVE